MIFFRNIRFRAWFLLPVVALGIQACGPKHKEQPDCGFVQNVYGERISWKESAPISLYVHQSFPSEMYPALDAAIKKWEAVLGRPAFKIAGYGDTGPMTPRQDGVNLIYWMNTWEDNKSAEQARTSVYWIGDQIKEADMRINAKDFTFYIDSTKDTRAIHLESLLVHELGHVLGLKHRDDAPSVMATYLSSNTIRDDITELDQKDVKCEY